MLNLQNKTVYSLLTWGGLAFVLIGLFLIGFVFNQAFAINATAINEIELQLQDETNLTNVFPVFWLVFLLVLLAAFMATMIIYREYREMIFFSISALIVSILITLLMSSPVNFDYQETNSQIKISEINTINGTFYNAEVLHGVKQVKVIPNDREFRLSMVALFTGMTLFNGFYTIYILTNFNKSGKF